MRIKTTVKSMGQAKLKFVVKIVNRNKKQK